MKNNKQSFSANKETNRLLSKGKGLFSSRKKIAIVLVIVLVLSFVGWRVLGNRPEQPQYQTVQVEKGTLISTVSASGQVITTNMVNVTTSASGVVKEVFVKDGETVQAGQKVMEVTLDLEGQTRNSQAYSSYLSAKNNSDAANANAYNLRSTKDTAWKKFYDLATSSQYQNGDGSPREGQRNSSAEFQSAQADWLAAEAKYNNQQAVIVQTKQAVTSSWLSYQQTSPQVYTPIPGTISNITLVVGMTLAQASGGTDTTNTSGQRAAVIKNDGTPAISINLSEVDVTKVKIGDKATVTIDAIAGKTFTGKVVSVDSIGSVSSGVTSYPVIIQLDTQTENILPNMAASANIIVETKDNVLLIPTTAVQSQNGQSTVSVTRNGQIQQVSVETGNTSDTQIEIISGLSQGDTVVTGTQTPTTGQQGGQGQSPFSPFGGGGFRGTGGGGQNR